MANNTTAYAGTSGVAKFDVGGSATTIASVISLHSQTQGMLLRHQQWAVLQELMFQD
jgi:hypothetical protein